MGISFPHNDVGMKFQHNDVGISFPCYDVGTAMHVNRKVSIPKVCRGNSGKIDGYLSNTRIELDKQVF